MLRLSFPGLHFVSVAGSAVEMEPIDYYLTAKAISGRRPRMGRPRTRQYKVRAASRRTPTSKLGRLPETPGPMPASGSDQELNAFIDGHPEIWEIVGDLYTRAH